MIARSRRRWGVILPLLLSIGAWSGCSRRGPVLPPILEGTEGGRRMAEMIAARPCPETLAADLEVRVDPAEGSAVQLFGSIRAAWPNRVRLQLRIGPFLPVLSMAVDGDSATVFLPREGVFWAGPSRDPAGGPILWARAILDALCPAGLAGGLQDPILSLLPGKSWVLVGTRSGPEDSGWIELRSDRKGRPGVVASYLLRDSDRRSLTLVHRTGKKTVDKREIPEKVRIETYDPATQIDVRLLRARPDPGTGRETFRIVPSKEARRLGDEEFREILWRLGSEAAGRFPLPDSAILG